MAKNDPLEFKTEILQKLDVLLRHEGSASADSPSVRSIKTYLETKLQKDGNHELDYVKKMLDRSGKKTILELGALHIQNLLTDPEQLSGDVTATAQEFIDQFSVDLGQEFRNATDKKQSLLKIQQAIHSTVQDIDQRNMDDLVELYGLKLRSKNLREELRFLNHTKQVYKEWQEILAQPSKENDLVDHQKEVIQQFLKFEKLLDDHHRTLFSTPTGEIGRQSVATPGTGAGQDRSEPMLDQFNKPVNRKDAKPSLLSNLLKIITPPATPEKQAKSPTHKPRK